MKVLRIKAFQETACYKKPFSNKVTETYPLPPYSTVKGMIHAVLKADQYIPFALSIQGDYKNEIVDYRKTYFVKKHQFAMPIVMAGIEKDTPEYSTDLMSSMPIYTHMLHDINLVFHVKAEASILENIYEAFCHLDSFISLGRHEDLVRIDEVAFTELEEINECEAVHSLYIPNKDIESKGTGIPYHLNWTYKIKKGIREWEKIPILFIAKDEELISNNFNSSIHVDDNEYPVFWNIRANE